MVIVAYDPLFKRRIKKIKNSSFKSKVKKQMLNIIDSPEKGKPMRYTRKGTREVYLSPYRLSYLYIKKEDKIVFLDLYHKDGQ